MAKRRARGAEPDRTSSELAEFIERDLDALAAGAVRTLAAVARSAPPPTARELRFEVFEAGRWLAVASRVLGGGGLADVLDAGPVLDDVPLPSVVGFSPGETAVEVERRLVRDALFRRFPAWWAEAGGATYPLPVAIAEHDLQDEFPLAWSGASGS